MKFLKQLKMEIKNTIRSKFLLIIGIILLAFSIALPLINVFSKSATQGGGGYYPMMRSGSVNMFFGGYRDYYYGEDAITVDGETIEPENPFYWQIKNNQDERGYMDKNWFSYSETLDIMHELLDVDLAYYMRFAKQIKTHDDYRTDIAWSGTSALYDKFIHEHVQTLDVDALKEAIGYRYGMNFDTFDATYVDITSEERLAAIDEADAKINRLFEVVEKNDFQDYLALRFEQENANLVGFEDTIKTLEQQIIENPKQEEMLSQQIESMKEQIKYVQEVTLPLLEYRREHNIVPRDGSWQNNALMDIENAQGSLQYTKILSEEDFNKDSYLVQQHRTYGRYKDAIQKQIDGFNNTLLIAQRSLDADMPDMKFVPTGARSQTSGFLGFSTFVALFAVLLGGYMIASEFQFGTIRLLMIRPLTRVKILMAKFAAGLLVAFAVYIGGCIINMLMNGICFGFSDFGFPNFTVSGEVGFLGYYLPKLLACTIPIIFAFCVAFMFSTVVKNIAVSIAVPIVLFVGCVIFNTVIMGYSYMGMSSFEWVGWTPIPYVQLADFFAQNSMINMMQQNGLSVNLGYGIGLLTVLSAICVGISILSFRKRDITH